MELRVLMLTDYLPPHFGGGVEKVVAELCGRLVRQGHTVAVLTLRTVPAPKLETNGRLTIYRAPAVDLTPRLGFQFAASAHVLTEAARVIRSFKPDIIHAHNLFFRTTEAASLLRTVCNVPLVTTLHLGKAEGGGGPLSLLIRTYEATIGKFVLNRSDYLIAVSDAVAEHARHIGGRDTPMTVIPNGVDTGTFHPSSNGRNGKETVLFVARLVPNKGPEALIWAAPTVLARHPKAQFVFVGDGPLRIKLKAQAQQLGIENAVHFLGIRYDVPDLMREASLFVRPSSLEGMPLTVLEAMATALPVVATPIAGTGELIQDGLNGHIVQVDDTAALANAVIKLLDDRSAAEKMGRNGRALVEGSYTWDAVVERTEHIYTEMLFYK